VSEIRIFLPAVSDDPVSDYLRELTKQICRVTGEETGYGLGGQYGYGENYENDVFMMHRFCWCDQDDCPWCSYCTCGDDFESNRCPYCKGEVKPAPNFLHKATGAAVRWYKYIGRGMEVDKADWPEIIRECIASLKVSL
jgi:hypothetical protein